MGQGRGALAEVAPALGLQAAEPTHASEGVSLPRPELLPSALELFLDLVRRSLGALMLLDEGVVLERRGNHGEAEDGECRDRQEGHEERQRPLAKALAGQQDRPRLATHALDLQVPSR